jgi:prevent-host-death family protein
MTTPVVVTSAEAREKWRDLLDAVSKQAVVIERHGKPAAALIAYEDFMELTEQLAELRAARRAAEAYGEWLSDETRARPYREIRQELAAEGLLDEQRGRAVDGSAQPAG